MDISLPLYDSWMKNLQWEKIVHKSKIKLPRRQPDVGGNHKDRSMTLWDPFEISPTPDDFITLEIINFNSTKATTNPYKKMFVVSTTCNSFQ